MNYKPKDGRFSHLIRKTFTGFESSVSMAIMVLGMMTNESTETLSPA